VFARNGMSIQARQVVDALKLRYVSREPGAANVTASELAAFLRTVTPDQIPADYSLLEVISSGNTEWILAAGEIAILHSIRDCLTMIHRMIDLEAEVAALLQSITPVLAAELIERPTLPLDEVPNSILTILDRVLDATIGWSSDQGRAGDKLLDQVRSVLTALHDEQAARKDIEEELNTFLEKEQTRIHKLEERLAASESGKLRSQRGRTIAAEMINAAMKGQKLTMSIAEFLTGPWYESMQLMAITKGVDGDEWSRAAKLTETVIWTYQPVPTVNAEKEAAAKQRLYRIIEHLPAEISELLLALAHSDEGSSLAISALEDDHVAMVSGQELEYVDVEPIPIEGSSISQRASVSRIILRKVTALQPGQWFTYEENDKNARIKLVLKLEDVKQLLFTNRNGMKALDKNYDELAYLMSSNVIKPLNHESVFSSTFATFYQGLIDEFDRKQKLSDEADQEEAEREAARLKAIEEAKALARAKEEAELKLKEEEKENRLKRAKAEVSKVENQAKVEEITAVVKKLNVGAWLKLPAADGELEECKLAVRVSAVDKLIFVNRAGIKMGDYSSEQLIALLVAEEAVIDDAGVEFEDTLAQVVSKLRQDRNKSYDDLTGS
jgi:hypothetical protein